MWLRSPIPPTENSSLAEDHTSLHHPHTFRTRRQSTYHRHIIILKRIQLPQIEMTWIIEIGDPFKCYRQTHIISTHPLRPGVIIQQHDREAHQQINGSAIRRPQTPGLFVDRIYRSYILNTATKIFLKLSRSQRATLQIWCEKRRKLSWCVSLHSALPAAIIKQLCSGGLCLILLVLLVWHWSLDLGANFISSCHYKL